MKFMLIICCSAILFFTAFTRLQHQPASFSKAAYEAALLKKERSLINCTPDWSEYYLSKDEVRRMIPLPGMGAHTWKISTTNDSAQFYFNQGINLYYGFHIIEAMPSFKKAQLFDSSCAILYWAEALAYGPNINDLGYFASPDALVAAQKAKALAAKASPKEKALIAAMQVRYSADSTQQRAGLNQQYADKMEAVFAAYPHDAEAGALFADALMVQHPWDLWQHNGQPQPWTPQIEKVLESVLRTAPDHPGANHYYIHTMEASPYAYKAMACADRLARLAPGMSHMVHMPSHIYIRTGAYEKGIAVNKAAVKAYLSYLSLYPGVADNAGLYKIHNLHMQAACSMNTGNYDAAIKDAMDCRAGIDTSFLSINAPMGDFIQYVYMVPEICMVTFEKWSEILSQPAIPVRFHYAAALQQFAKGMAYANANDLKNAQAALTRVTELSGEKDMAVVFPPFNSPASAAVVMKNILAGTIAEKEQHTDAAMQYFRDAVKAEDSLVYNEPRDWLIPARHFLGDFLLHSGNYKEAKKVFREDLSVQPKNYFAAGQLNLALFKEKIHDRNGALRRSH